MASYPVIRSIKALLHTFSDDGRRNCVLSESARFSEQAIWWQMIAVLILCVLTTLHRSLPAFPCRARYWPTVTTTTRKTHHKITAVSTPERRFYGRIPIHTMYRLFVNIIEQHCGQYRPDRIKKS